MKWGAAMEVKTKVAYAATVGEFYQLKGKRLDGVVPPKRWPRTHTWYFSVDTAFPEIAGPFKKKSLIQRIKEKF